MVTVVNLAGHKLPTAFASVVLVMLIGFAIWMNVLYRDTRANLARALDAEAESAQVSDFMLDVFKVADPGEARGRSVTASRNRDSRGTSFAISGSLMSAPSDVSVSAMRDRS